MSKDPIRGSDYLDFVKNPENWQEPEVIIRLREDAEFLRSHGYPESDIAALAELKIDTQADKFEGWSTQPSKK